ncbi:MAG: cytochrome c [Gemmatimonadaceae bacterium]|nr:cytochrome c [Gemmatimonadaceae bacterium]
MRNTMKLSVAMVLVLAACGGEKKPEADTGAAAPTVVATADVGAEKYAQVCAVCHQATGLGVEGNFPPLAGSDWVTGKSEVPIAIVLHGLQGEIEVLGKKYNNAMAPWGEALNDAEIAAVLTYARSQWGNTAAAVTADEVKAARAKYASRTTPWTVAELTPMR